MCYHFYLINGLVIHPLTEHGVHTRCGHIDIFCFNCGMTIMFTATSFASPYPSLPGWWSWCRVRRSSRRCSCRASGSQTPWRCWWWGWRGRPRPAMGVCSAPQCTAPSGCPSPSPTRSPSRPKPETHMLEGLVLYWTISFGQRCCCCSNLLGMTEINRNWTKQQKELFVGVL